jgi:hypothetical protein
MRTTFSFAACALLAGLTLAGCGDVQKAVTFTQTDLTNAIAIDTAGMPATQEKLLCDQWVQKNLTTIQGAVANAPQVTGVFSATSEADAAASQVLTALGPTGQQAFEIGCGPEVVHVVGLVSGFKALQLIAPAAVTAIK